MDTTKDVIAAMLTENTGAHFLDSGGAYGRHWERNQGRDFEAEPYATLDVGIYRDSYNVPVLEFFAIVSAYHWLTERLHYAPDWQAKFDAFAADRDDTHWLEDMEAFAESVGADFQTVNTYNGECILNQTLQFVVINPEESDFDNDATPDGALVLLQVHGGCDVRGGYTAPKLFWCGGYGQDFSIFDYDHAWLSIECEMPEAMQGRQAVVPGMETPPTEVRWLSELGGQWENEYHFRYGQRRYLHDYPASSDPADRGNGKVYVDADARVAYCPITGAELAF